MASPVSLYHNPKYGRGENDHRYSGAGEFLLEDQWDKKASASHDTDHRSSVPHLGEPTAKKRLSYRDAATLLVSLISLGLAVWVVASESMSWRLGVANNQLIVIGFLLSIMNLCLASVTPTLFALLEARLGPSTLQNYDGILRNSPIASGLSLTWRGVLAFMLALPILLSIAYKAFIGGESSINIHSTDYFPNTTFYGFWRPPGMQADVFSIGPTLFTNASNPFRVATTPGIGRGEKPLPEFPQPYGQNILLLNEESSAVLDTLQTDYLAMVQELLHIGESWIISAPVSGTVATLLKFDNPNASASTFTEMCENGILTRAPLYNGWNAFLVDQGPYNMTVQYLSLYPGTSQYQPKCKDLPQYAYGYKVERWQCHGTWRVTRASFDLVLGSCNGGRLPWTKQQVFEHNILAPSNWYMPSLIESISRFGTEHETELTDKGGWLVPTAATAVATMLWSRVAALNGGQWYPFDSTNPKTKDFEWTLSDGTVIPFDEVGFVYPINESSQTILYTRPTLQKSPLLYAVFAVQPLLIIVCLALSAWLYSVPVTKGFGLISILSGINHHTLDLLSGASLSGELKKPVRLVIDPMHDDPKAAIHYRILSLSDPDTSARKKKLQVKRNYY
ncbi:hypothetical protein F4679DRAFT_534560 [Xylaria curta]|nr:hypothetical protein F4679DRAFT_534560 [Xylaria curta]